MGIDASSHQALPAPLVLRDELGAFEDGDVLLHGGKAHRVVPSQVGYGVLASEHQPHDVPAGGVGEGMQDKVGPLLGGHTIYNHTVVC